MKALKKILTCAAVLAVLLCSNLTAFASDYLNVPYYIQNYDINVNVLENNTFEISEHIDVYFNESRHGIYRTIPVENTVRRQDGTTDTVKAKIRKINVSEGYSKETDFGVCQIKIGSENDYVIGEHSYDISYQYVLGRDKSSGFDEFYYNIIGDSWDTYIENVSFTVTMPKEFDAEKLGFSTGAYGAIGSDIVDFAVDGNVITGRLTHGLEPYEAVTMRLELDDGYFYYNKILYALELGSLVGIPLIALIVAVVLWAKYGNDKKVVAPVEFYPPNGMSSCDVAYWSKGALTDTDVVPTLIELANEGYVEISRAFDSKNDFEIRKLKSSYDGADENKELFFKGLFAFSDENGTVHKAGLENSFYLTIKKIVGNYDTLKNRTKVFESKSLIARVISWVLSVASIALIIVISWFSLIGSEKTVPLLIGLLIGVASFAFSFFIRKRTDSSHAILEKIKGFKNFLETAEKDRLETLVEQDPQYFYDILPYAYVLGVSTKWMSKFESIAMAPPSWYGGSHGMFDYYVFSRFINSTMSSATTTMVSTPQSSSSGGGFSVGGSGFSGGGISGGGVGGGGGGSW